MFAGVPLQPQSRCRHPLVSACLAGMLALAAGPAAAHAVLDTKVAPAGTYHKLVVRITHGCHGSPTVGVSVALPEGISGGKPQPKPGWQVAIEREPLAKSFRDGHGHEVTERVARIVWHGGRLEDDQFDEFAVQVRLPDRPGETLRFPVVQRCETGEMRWTDVPEPGQPPAALKAPAPSLLLAPRP
jgi:uncharacterized protein YcnI